MSLWAKPEIEIFDETDAGAVAAHSEDRQPSPLGGGNHSVGAVVVGVDDRHGTRQREFQEQPQLGGEVGLEARMIVEVIARNIGEGSGGDVQAVEPILIEPVRGRFDCEVGDAFAGELIERAVQRNRIGRRQRTVGLPGRRNNADRADARGAIPERAPDLPRECRDRGFPAGAGDGRDGARLTRIDFGGRQRERAPRVADLDKGHASREWHGGRLLGQDRNRAGGDGGLDETQAVGLAAGYGDEDVAAFDHPAVRRHAADFEIGVARVDFCIWGQNLAKLHGGSVDAATALPAFLDRSQYQVIGIRQA